jgi:hypothetical protein
MHSDQEILKIFGEDSKLHDDKMTGLNVEGMEEKDTKGWRQRCVYTYVNIYMCI